MVVDFHANRSVFHLLPPFVDWDSILDHQAVADHQQAVPTVVAVGVQYQLLEIVVGEAVEALEKQTRKALVRLLEIEVAEALKQSLVELAEFVLDQPVLSVATWKAYWHQRIFAGIQQAVAT